MNNNFIGWFYLMVGLYGLAMFFSLFFKEKDRLANLTANLTCFLAALAGIVISGIYLTNDFGVVNLVKVNTLLPYINLTIRIDGISVFFLLALSLLVAVVSIYSIGYVSHYYNKKPVGLFNFLYAVFILSMVLVLVAGDMISFYIAWELMSLSSYFLVAFEDENKEAREASSFYIIMTHIGTAFLLVAFIIIYVHTGSWDIQALPSETSSMIKNVLFVMFVIGFGTKAGVVPLHVWLPYAHPAAPSNVSALMSGIMIKTAVYGLVRFIFAVLNVQYAWWGAVLLILGIVSAVIGVAYAFLEKNIKRLLAYSSIENIGIILMGLGIAVLAGAKDNPALLALALTAAMLHTLNHSIFKGLLFMSAGSIHFATHSKNMEEMGGLIKTMPITGGLILIGSLAISAIVPFNGFIGEWLTYQAFFMNIEADQAFSNIITIIAVAALALAGALAAGCFVKLIGIAFLGVPRTEKAAQAKEVPRSMLLSKGVLALLCLVTGLFPLPFIHLIDLGFYPITGLAIAPDMQGASAVLWYPLQVAENSIMPWGAVLIGIIAVGLLVVLVRLIGGKTIRRYYGTWDCGFISLNQRMQYTATGFSKPIAIVLRMLYQPAREINVEEGTSPYHPKKMHYRVKTEQSIEKYLYQPVIDFVKRISRKTKITVQTGSIHLYLLYIFVTIFMLLFYNRMV